MRPRRPAEDPVEMDYTRFRSRSNRLAIITVALLGSAVVAYAATPGPPAADIASSLVQTSTIGCGTRRIGEISIATVGRTPLITVSANDTPVTLILDTGAERTVLTPAAAERIRAQPPRITFQR